VGTIEQLGSEGRASSSQLQLSGTHCHFTFAPVHQSQLVSRRAQHGRCQDVCSVWQSQEHRARRQVATGHTWGIWYVQGTRGTAGEGRAEDRGCAAAPLPATPLAPPMSSTHFARLAFH